MIAWEKQEVLKHDQKKTYEFTINKLRIEKYKWN